MTLSALIQTMVSLGIRFGRDEHGLHVVAPAGTLSPELRAALTEHRDAVAAALGLSVTLAPVTTGDCGAPSETPREPEHPPGPAPAAGAQRPRRPDLSRRPPAVWVGLPPIVRRSRTGHAADARASMAKAIRESVLRSRLAKERKTYTDCRRSDEAGPQTDPGTVGPVAGVDEN